MLVGVTSRWITGDGRPSESLRSWAAVSARDMKAISASGDEIVEICEGCHIAFKPDLPTGGKFGELSPTTKDFEED